MTEKTKIIAGMEIQEDVLKLRIEKEQLEQENNKLLDVINNQDVKIADLEKENAGLKETIADIEKNFRICESNADTYYDQLTKAKEIIRTFLNMPMPNNEEVFADVGIFLTKAEQFLKECK